jgi:hypothetical protein
MRERTDATLELRFGKSRLFIKFNDIDPIKRKKDIAAARYLLSQANEALDVMEKTRETKEQAA